MTTHDPVYHDQRLIKALLSDRPVTYKPVVARALKHTEAAGRHKGVTTATVFLSNLLYWDAKTTDPDGWVYKDRDETEEETALTRYEQERARAFLLAAGVMEEERRGFPARMHFRVLYGPLLELLRLEVERAAEKTARKNYPQNAEGDTVLPTERRHRLAIKKERQSGQLKGDTVSPTDLSVGTSGRDDQSLTSVDRSNTRERQAEQSGRPEGGKRRPTDRSNRKGSGTEREPKPWRKLDEHLKNVPAEEVGEEALSVGEEIREKLGIPLADAVRLAAHCLGAGRGDVLIAAVSATANSNYRHAWPTLLTAVINRGGVGEEELLRRLQEARTARDGSEAGYPPAHEAEPPDPDPVAEELWGAVLGDVASELDDASLAVWFQGAVPTALEGGSLTLCVPNSVVKEYIESRLKKPIEDSMRSRPESVARLDLECYG